jgi:predicted nucleic acid-binding protein
MSVPDAILVDTGSWIALFDAREEHHRAVAECADLIEGLDLVVPWPILYETLRTRFVRRPDWVASLDERLRRSTVSFIDDREYCDDAYSLTIEYATRLKRDISMVDMLCRLLIEDPNIRVNYLLTINPKDFHDVCARNRVTILP